MCIEKGNLKELYEKLERDMKKKTIQKLLAQEKNINYSPQYQRNYIWDNAKASKLIETIILNREVPPLTVIVKEDTYEIIDGRQRYETILRFFNNEFALKESALTKLKEFGGRYYCNLKDNLKTIFLEYKIKMITYTVKNGVLFSNNDLDYVKRDLFRRYNSGMTALTKSEVARAKYLYDDLTNQLRDYLLTHHESYEICSSLYLPISKRNIKDRERINLLLMNARELLTIPYIPIIGVKTVSFGTAEIEKFYNTFVIKNNLQEKRNEFFKISEIIFNIKEKMKKNDNVLHENILFLKSVYWMLSILYQQYSDEFYSFNVNQFCHYIENTDNAISYYNNYKNLGSDHIISRHNYVKKYINEKLKINTDEYLLNITENRKAVGFKKDLKIKKEKIWNGMGNEIQLSPKENEFAVDEIISKIKAKRLIIRPNYQRTEVKNIEKASKIIESIILGIKLPPIYVTTKIKEDGLEYCTVIDGQQRIISILSFMGEEILDENYQPIQSEKQGYALKGLKELKYLNGKTYQNIDCQKLIEDYIVDAIVIEESVNNKFDPVDMFLRLNENPCTIKKNSFEFWNSFDVVETIQKIKQIARYILFKQDGKVMKEAELVTVLAYMAKKEIDIENCDTFFKIHTYTENRDKMNERVEIKLSINNKNEITNYLEMLKPHSVEETHLLKCLDEVESFIQKLKDLSQGDENKLIEIFNPYVETPRRGCMKDFYMMWMILKKIDNHVIRTYHEKIIEDLTKAFKLMKNLPQDKDVEFFIAYIKLLIQKYEKYTI